MSLKLMAVCALGILSCAVVLQADPWQSSYDWKRIALRSAAQYDQGDTGGEGFQAPWDIKFDPKNANYVYMCTDTSRVWRSIDGGDNWKPIPNGIKNVGGLSVFVHRGNSNIVLCSGFASDNGVSSIYYTNNACAADSEDVFWHCVRSGTGAEKKGLRGQNLFCQKETTSTMFAGTQNGDGILISTNSGFNWSPIAFDGSSDISNDDIGYILNIMQNPHNSNLEIWVCSYSGLFKITEPSSGVYHCVEMTPAGLPSKYTGWNKPTDPSGAMTSIDSIVYYSEPASVRVDYDGSSTTDYWHTKWQSISVSPNTEYRVEGYIKTVNMDTAASKGACINVCDSRGYSYGNWDTNLVQGTSANFVPVTRTFTTSSSTTSVSIMLRRHPYSAIEAQTWYDDVKLYAASDASQINLLTGAYAKFSGDTPTAIYFGDNANEIFVSCGLHGIYRATDGSSFNQINSGLLSFIGLNRINLNGDVGGGRTLIAGVDGVSNHANLIWNHSTSSWSAIESDDLTNIDLMYDINHLNSTNAYTNSYYAPTGINGETMIHPFSTQALYKSTDSGANWAFCGEGFTGGRASGGWSFGGDSRPRATTEFIADFGPIRTEDGGRTWTRLYTGTSLNQRSGSSGIMDPSDPDTIVCAVGNYSQQTIWKTESGGELSNEWSECLSAVSYYPFMCLLGDIIFVNNRTINMTNWTTGTISRSVVAASRVGTGYIYARSTDGTGTTIYKSGTGGTTWSSYTQKVPVTLAGSIKDHGIVVSPIDADKIYVGTTWDGLYLLQSDGSWLRRNESNGGLSMDTVQNSYNLYCLAVDPVNPDFVYAGRNAVEYGVHSTESILVSDDGGLNWYVISGNLEEGNIWNIAVNPNNDAVYIATDSGTCAMSSLVLNYHFDYEDIAQTNIYNDSIHAITNSTSQEGDAERSDSGTSFVSGWKGSAMDFDGTSGYASLSTYPDALNSINTTNSFTVEALVKFDNWNARVNGPIIFDRSSYGTCSGFFLRAYYNKVSFVVANGSSDKTVESATGLLHSDQWHYIAATFDEGEIKIYLDGDNVTPGGSVQANFSTVSLQSNTNLEIGKGLGAFLDGKIDELRIYNRALSASEIEARYYNYYIQSN